MLFSDPVVLLRGTTTPKAQKSRCPTVREKQHMHRGPAGLRRFACRLHGTQIEERFPGRVSARLPAQ
jgi:hypothetical protein